MTARFKSSLSGHSKKMHPTLPVQIVPLPRTSSSEIIDAFICTYCNCIALNEYNLKVHWTKTHRENNLSYETKKVSVHSDVEYQCFWCQDSSDIHSLKEHCKKHHSNERFMVVAVVVSRYKCSECSLVFNSVDILRRHFSMDHPSKLFCYIVVSAPKYVNSPNKASQVSSNSAPQKQKTATYKCPKCYYTCTFYKSIVRHLRKHFSFYLCCECDGIYHTSLKYKKHMQNKHPGSSSEPVILNESESKFEKAKRDIIIISVSGKRSKITDQEIADGEKECFLKMNTEVYSYDEPLEDMDIDLPRLKETARKSTGGSKQSPGKGSKQLNVTPQPSESGTDNAFLNFRSNGTDINLPRLSQQAFDMNARFSIDEDQPVEQT